MTVSNKDIEGIKQFIKEQVVGAGKTGCVVGVSGGIDSAVIVSLCKHVFPDTTIGVSMPVETLLSPDSTFRSVELCNKLNIPLQLQPIKYNLPTLQIKKLYDLKFITKKQHDLASGNWCARQRMANLYYIAELNDSLVIGTDNKSENYIGYFTKYADGGVDINPIGQYFKSEVYELAKLLKIPRNIINTPPSAELWTDQTDEDELGMSYNDIECAIRFLNNECDVFVKPKVLKKVKKLHKTTEHKRNLPPEYERK